MFRNIFIPADGSELSEKAIREGVALARSVGASVTGFHAARKFHHVILQEGAFALVDSAQHEEFDHEEQARAEQCFELIRKLAQEEGVACECYCEFTDCPHYEAIVQAAQKKGCDLILMGSPMGQPFLDKIIGSDATRVINHTNIPVLVCH
jgi:nucleotide-binding universal stress UspA family protein